MPAKLSISPDAAIRVTGLREVQRALKKMDDGTLQEFRSEAKAIAEVVAADARARVPFREKRKHAKTRIHARDSIKTGVTMRGSYVQGGKKSVPYYGWLDFGSRTPVSGRPRSVGPWRNSGKGPENGRFIYPAFFAHQRTIIRRTEKAVKTAQRKAGL